MRRAEGELVCFCWIVKRSHFVLLSLSDLLQAVLSADWSAEVDDHRTSRTDTSYVIEHVSPVDRHSVV